MPDVEDQTDARIGRRVYYGWVVVVVCFLVMTLVAPVLASFSVFYAAILQDLGWQRGDTAIAMSIYMVVAGLGAPLAGHLIDRFGPRLVMPLGSLIAAGALVWMSRMTELWHFYIAYGVVAAIGATMLHIVPMTTILSNWFVKNRGLAIGIVTAGQGVGQVGIPLIQLLIDRFGWRGAYLSLSSLVFLIPTALILTFLHLKPSDRGLSVSDEASPWTRVRRSHAVPTRREVMVLDHDWAGVDWTVGRAVRTFRFWALTLVMALFAAGFLMISVQLVAYLRGAGYSSMLAASVVSVQGLVNVFGRFGGGALSDRIGREATLTISVVSFLFCLVLLNLAGGVVSILLVYVFALLYGIGSGMTLPVLMAAAADMFQGKQFGKILGMVTLGGFSGGALGAWLGGHLFDQTNAYTLNFLVAAVLMAISAGLIWKARPSHVRVVRTVAPASLAG